MTNATAPARRKIEVLRITDRAGQRIREILAAAPEGVVGLRVGVKKGGCAGMSYTVDYAREIAAGDDVVERDGARVVIDPGAVLFLLGAEMDYRTDKLAAQFVFNNPNQTSACGCGESVALVPAAQAD